MNTKETKPTQEHIKWINFEQDFRLYTYDTYGKLNYKNRILSESESDVYLFTKTLHNAYTRPLRMASFEVLPLQLSYNLITELIHILFVRIFRLYCIFGSVLCSPPITPPNREQIQLNQARNLLFKVCSVRSHPKFNSPWLLCIHAKKKYKQKQRNLW